MLQEPPELPTSWADICALKRRLRQSARETGHYLLWRDLDDDAKKGLDTIEGWLGLCEKIAEGGEWYGSYIIRDGAAEDDDDGEQLYGCPNHRRCERVMTACPRGRPICELSGEPMAELPSPDAGGRA
ncbi:hypothetical protein [Herbidospora daliensis]|uniref:hypothetical protein n=1 Tax=Herbidospora daliensis TaxID=295585 RepID=UPI0007807074|nr:hypothetical protein [Herbidospora daliensis]